MRRNFSGPSEDFARLSREFVVEPADLRVSLQAGGMKTSTNQPHSISAVVSKLFLFLANEDFMKLKGS